MSIGSWTPETEKAAINIDKAWLKRCIALSNDASLAELPAPFTDEELQRYSPVMRLTLEPWQEAVADLSNDELIALIRFFYRCRRTYQRLGRRCGFSSHMDQ